MTKELKFAIKLAKDAGKIVIDGLDKVVVKKSKADKRDIYTNIDREAERMIINRIKKKYPHHKIYGEEYGKIDAESDYVWIIDPIDGTKYYVAGIKLFDVSIALWKGDTPIVGVVYSPALNDIYFAEKGKGAFHNQKRLRVSNINRLNESIIYLDITGSNKLKTEEQKITMRRLELIFKNVYRFRAFGLGAVACCYVAQGGYDGYFDLTGKEKILDIAAGITIAKEAGAKVTGLDGKYHGQDTSNIVITNGKIHNKFLKLLKEKRANSSY